MNFQLVDVFGAEPFTGNPLAVIVADDRVSGQEMQEITRWLNLSETAFLLAPTTEAADYRVRIFTLAREMPFAGHPILGTCHAWLRAGGRARHADRIIQECLIGLVEVRREEDWLSFAAPSLLRSGRPSDDEIDEVAHILRIGREAITDATWADNGPGWIAIMLASAEAVLAVDPIGRHDRRVDIGIVGPQGPGAETAFEVRAIFSDAQGNLREDPVTGSLNASIGQWLFSSGRARERYIAAQGTRLGRS